MESAIVRTDTASSLPRSTSTRSAAPKISARWRAPCPLPVQRRGAFSRDGTISANMSRGPPMAIALSAAASRRVRALPLEAAVADWGAVPFAACDPLAVRGDEKELLVLVGSREGACPERHPVHAERCS